MYAFVHEVALKSQSIHYKTCYWKGALYERFRKPSFGRKLNRFGVELRYCQSSHHIKQGVSQLCPKLPADKAYTNFTRVFMDMGLLGLHLQFLTRLAGGHHLVIFVLRVLQKKGKYPPLQPWASHPRISTFHVKAFSPEIMLFNREITSLKGTIHKPYSRNKVKGNHKGSINKRTNLLTHRVI
ncbi:hypothetical protein VNO77_16123 [Canavalia gladiata]|uniref:Uncharacterized protein n=1 Tax=Canavalia gladiata TaxID=3824 RepID=A0AAN9M3K6_CANGL